MKAIHPFDALKDVCKGELLATKGIHHTDLLDMVHEVAADDLIEQVRFMADVGSAEEFGDALERIKAIAEVVDEYLHRVEENSSGPLSRTI